MGTWQFVCIHLNNSVVINQSHHVAFSRLDGLPFHSDYFDFVRIAGIGLGVPEDEVSGELDCPKIHGSHVIAVAVCFGGILQYKMNGICFVTLSSRKLCAS
jgi:hypothetical protein